LIRAAVEADIPDILRLGKLFFNEAGWPEFASWDEASVAATLRGLIQGTIEGGLIVAQYDGETVGMTGFVCYPFYCNLGMKFAQEQFWYVETQHRFGAGRLLFDALEESARSKGATVLIMSSVASLRSEALARLYRKRGFAPGENTYIKRIAA
jgi:GNAT superfamily N-acetyltransferase